MSFERPSRYKAIAALGATVIMLVGAVAVSPVSAQDCAGRISTTVATEGLPGGEWSVSDGCLSAATYFEYSDGPIHAEAAVSTVTYDDGHSGRVAAGVLTLGTGLGLSIVGVEDAATGLVKWSAVLGDYSSNGNAVTVSGDGVSLFPTQPAQISLSIDGTGTDVTTLLDQAGATTMPTQSTVTTVVASETTQPSLPSTTAAPEPTSTSVPAPAEPSVTTTTTVPSPDGAAETPPTTTPSD